MIKNRNIADDAAIELHKILGPGQANEVLWVATVGTQAYEYLRGRVNPANLFTSLEEAGHYVVTDSNTTIFMAPNHAETVASAAAINLDKIGMNIIGLGSGDSRPTFTFSATASTITITAASIVMKNFILVPSIDSVVSPLVVSAADVTLDYEVQDASDTVEFVNSLLTTAAADRLTVNCKYVGRIGGDACVNAINLVGVDTARIRIDFYGVASTAIVEFHTTACHDIVITGNFYNDGTSLTKNVVDTATGSTWSAAGWDGNSSARFSGGDNAALAGDDIGAVAAAIAVIDVFHDVATADATTNAVMSDVVGNKSDAAVNAVTTTKTLMAYLKGVLAEITVPTKDSIANGFINDVIGQKEDTTAAGAVTETDSLVGYIKQLVAAAIANAAQVLKVDGVTLATAPVANSLAAYIASGGTALGQELPDSMSLVDIIGNYTGAYNGAAQDDNIKASLDLLHTQNAVGEATGDADIDISEADYTGYINILTVTAPATGLLACRIDIDVNKATTGLDTIATAADTIDISLVGQVDGTNYRTIENATQITANGDGTLENNESGVSFSLGPLGPNESVQVHVKLSAERDDAELPYRVSYVGAAPTVTPIAAA